MKKLSQFLLGIVFTVLFLLFLVFSSLKFQLLTAAYWTAPLSRANAYSQIEQDLQAQIAKQPGMEVLAGGINAGLLQRFVEVNLTRIEAYFLGKSDSLLIFAPVEELRLPPAIAGQKPFSQLSAETDLAVFLGSFMTAVQAAELENNITNAQGFTRQLPLVWTVALVLLLVLLASYYLLGEGGMVGQVKAAARLFLVAGGFAALVGWAVKGILGGALAQAVNIPPILQTILPAWINGFFEPIVNGGLVVAFFGLGAIFLINYLVKSGKLEAKEAKLETKKAEAAGVKNKKWLMWAGVAAVAVVGVLLLVGKPKVGLNKEKAGSVQSQQEMRLTDEVYTSNFGWAMRYPQGWAIKKEDELKLVGFAKEGKDWAFIAVELSERMPEVDKGTLVAGLTQLFNNGQIERFPNSKLAQEPQEDEWQGWKRFSLAFDYDHASGVRSRQKRVYLFPPQSGNGFLVYWETVVTNWEKYNQIFQESSETFTAK
ncbi:hypothetical protein HYW66_01880 [Candidatus Microgenomates bacterium]|nr:hypothetical protein [Candidatus Microgenomates bacterium]